MKNRKAAVSSARMYWVDSKGPNKPTPAEIASPKYGGNTMKRQATTLTAGADNATILYVRAEGTYEIVAPPTTEK